MRIFSLALLVLAVWVNPVAAQDTDSNMMRMEHSAPPSDPQDLQEVVSYTTCSMSQGNYPKMILAALPGSPASLHATYWTASLSNSCDGPGNKWMTPPWFIRGVAAEYFLKRDFDQLGSNAKHRSQKIFEMPESSKIEGLNSDEQRELALVRFGSCAAEGDRAGAEKLLATKWSSTEEATAFAALMPAIQKCVPVGTTFKINRTQMRAYLAEGAYRNAVAAQAERN